MMYIFCYQNRVFEKSIEDARKMRRDLDVARRVEKDVPLRLEDDVAAGHFDDASGGVDESHAAIGAVKLNRPGTLHAPMAHVRAGDGNRILFVVHVSDDESGLVPVIEKSHEHRLAHFGHAVIVAFDAGGENDLTFLRD